MIAAWLLSWRPSLSPNSALRRPEPRSVRDDRLANNLAEAHWYASTEGDVRNITYTSVDALADAWFEANAGTASGRHR